jgi:MFS-type transporter involved in bile tolerance (Atg22 family)
MVALATGSNRVSILAVAVLFLGGGGILWRLKVAPDARSVL